MKLIEVKRAKEFAATLFADPVLKMAVNAVLDKAPEFELVRCKDCINAEYFHGVLCCAMAHDVVRQKNDFCSYGERETNATD